MSLLRTLRFIIGHPLNEGQAARALLRFVRWQLRSRITARPIVHQWIRDSKFYVRAGETGLTGNIYTGLHEFPEMSFLLHFLRASDLFVDIGSNAGSYTILACSAVGARGIAFEPIPETYNRLLNNIRLNSLAARVTCINKALGASVSIVTFSSNRDTMNHAVVDGERPASVVDVEVSTLDTELNGTSPNVLKIDVEGFESEVLSGAVQTLRDDRDLRVVIMEINQNANRYGFDEKGILDLMRSYDFEPYSYDPYTRLLTRLDGRNAHSGNTIFIRDLSFVTQRLASGPVFSMHGRSL
jgi:FkbM family methyltransferase